MEHARPRSLESAQKEAKRWLDALRRHDRLALERYRRVRPAVPDAPTLRDVQHALALERGFSGWTALRDHVAATTAHASITLADYDARAQALLEAYITGTPEAMQRHWRLTWHQRSWPAMRTYVQIDLGRVAGDEVTITLDDARYLVAREHGFVDWNALTYDIATRPTHGVQLAKPVRLVSRRDVAADDEAGDDGDDEGDANASRNWNDILHQLAASDAVGIDGHGQLTDALLADLVAFPLLTRLSLGGARAISDAGVRTLVQLPALTHLDLSGTSVTDRGLDALRALTKLESISLAWTDVTDAGIAALAQCRQLRQVNLMGTACGDGAVRALRDMPALAFFTSGAALTDAGLPALHDYPIFSTWHPGDVRSATLGYNGGPNRLLLRGSITDRGLFALRGLDGLCSLNLDDAALRISGSGLEALTALPNLAALAVHAHDDEMPVLARMPALRWLGCQDAPATDAGWVELAASRSIEDIWGRRCYGLSDAGFRALARMPSLRSLSASCKNVSDSALAALPSFASLRELMPMDIPDAGYRHIARCEALETLTLMYCRDTTDAATEHIVRLPQLARYFASYTRITDRTPELLSRMDTLEAITFDSCAGLTDVGVGALARLPRLRELRLSGRQLTADVTTRFPERVRVRYSV